MKLKAGQLVRAVANPWKRGIIMERGEYQYVRWTEGSSSCPYDGGGLYPDDMATQVEPAMDPIDTLIDECCP